MTVDTHDRGVALCEHCSKQRQASGSVLEPLAGVVDGRASHLFVVSGCCHDCGAGFCLCGGFADCERCPRKNARVVVQALTLYRIVVPRAPSTIPGPLNTPITGR